MKLTYTVPENSPYKTLRQVLKTEFKISSGT